MTSANYDIVGKHYTELRKPDFRIAEKIHYHLQDSNSIINIGAGTGSYEPEDKVIAAIEPSDSMVSQRIRKANAAIFRARAEYLPFPTNSFDAALSILSIHHWTDWKRGLSEALRVAKQKVVLFTWIYIEADFWLYSYFPELKKVDCELFPSLEELASILGELDVITVPIPNNCTDGFLCAYWSRPERYLCPRTRSAISTFSRLKSVDNGLEKLSRDLKTGQWHKKYGHTLEFEEYDFGYRVIASKNST